MLSFRGTKKNKKGFTLIEIIVAIGIIAIISGFVLQIFISAKNLNQKAADLDNSVFISSNLIELFKSGNSEEDFIRSTRFKNMKITDAGGSPSIELYYDADWKIINEKSKNNQADFIISGTITHASDLYSLKIKTAKLKPYTLSKESNILLYTVESSIFFDEKR